MPTFGTHNMIDKIKLLPDAIANQIAAGEVIQRPASVVKELMENAIDAGASHIRLIIKNAGKTLIQIIDNGCGMSETDARMCFEKHATSKISTADDLFNIRTMGFRGEAMASIAAIAQVELKTKQWDATTGTLIDIEGMKVTNQSPCATENGTSIAVKNLFFNVPARRNFLKSDSVELKYILEEFFRIALINPKVGFQLFVNENELYHLKSGNSKQRICSLFDEKYASQIVPLAEETYALKISGFIGKPAYAKKTRGEQYLYVNNRFIKSAYLHHAIVSAYEEMLPKESHPFYLIQLDIDPSRIDINVHPQKYEVKFDDDKLVYTFLNLAVKHALGAYAVSPTLDFEQEDHLNKTNSFTQSADWIQQSIKQGAATVQNIAKTESRNSSYTASGKKDNDNLKNWQQLYQSALNTSIPSTESQPLIDSKNENELLREPYQIHNKYILSQIKSGIILIDQQAAHERILFERFIEQLAHNKIASQPKLFPDTLSLDAINAQVMEAILPEVNQLGFDVQPFGNNTFIVHALPADLTNVNEKELFDELIEQFKNTESVSALNKRQKIAQILAKSAAIKRGKNLGNDEMKTLIDELFACENPYTALNGKKTFVQISSEELAAKFE